MKEQNCHWHCKVCVQLFACNGQEAVGRQHCRCLSWARLSLLGRLPFLLAVLAALGQLWFRERQLGQSSEPCSAAVCE